MNQQTPKDEFIETMGRIMQTDGPRIAGRIFGLLLVEARPFSLNEMAEALAISKASASTNARLLLASGMLQLTSKPGDRQDYYEVGPSPYKRMITTISARTRESAQRVRDIAAAFPQEEPSARARVEELARFYSLSAEVLDNWAEQLSDKTDISSH